MDNGYILKPGRIMYTVIIVEDDKGIAEGIGNCLAGWGMEARQITDFRHVMEEIEEYKPHLVIMDITLPYMGGYHWCQEIRKTSSVPIIFISSATDNMNIIMAMNMGADDYIPKPFELQAAGAVLNTEDNTLLHNGIKIVLPRNEYMILLTLMQNKNKVVSREKLMEALWETDSFVDENTLTVNVGRLRRTLEEAGLKDIIKTRFGVGYILEAE